MAIANKLQRKVFGISWNGGGNNDGTIDKKLNGTIDKKLNGTIDKKLKRKLDKHKKK